MFLNPRMLLALQSSGLWASHANPQHPRRHWRHDVDCHCRVMQPSKRQAGAPRLIRQGKLMLPRCVPRAEDGEFCGFTGKQRNRILIRLLISAVPEAADDLQPSISSDGLDEPSLHDVTDHRPAIV